ncbi:unnamed protein product [Chrysodeixis includens]|uniref:Uncharacterized protein n=1 Tax=Chrysodeixis includens TaxID=689277 RepID=A0A9N8KR92_CHRIL|nr:unnamed protein product [Chrysodeixis includens]
MQLLLLCVCASALGGAQGDYGVYAHEYSREYEPYMYAAFPLHAPLPVLRVLSPAPLAPRDRRYAPSVQHPVYARAPYREPEYTSAEYEAAYEPAAAGARQAARYAAAAPDEPAILYARPTPLGGYTYHRAPHRAAAKRAPAADAPYIIRVHKYRIVKER